MALEDKEFETLADEIRVIGLLEGLTRGAALSLLASAAEQIAKLGGEVATINFCTAISDIAQWP